MEVVFECWFMQSVPETAYVSYPFGKQCNAVVGPIKHCW